jgi:hypothetical protein
MKGIFKNYLLGRVIIGSQVSFARSIVEVTVSVAAVYMEMFQDLPSNILVIHLTNIFKRNAT